MFPLTMHRNKWAKELNFLYGEDNLEQVGFNSVLKAKVSKQQYRYACMIIFKSSCTVNSTMKSPVEFGVITPFCVPEKSGYFNFHHTEL